MLDSYTSYESIRAVLGLNTRELPDTLLAVEIYDLMLEASFAEISVSLTTDYDTADILGTAESLAFVRAMRIFSTHAVALQCAKALPLFSMKAVTDGKAGMYRDGNSPYKPTMAEIENSYKQTRRALQEAYAIYLGSPLAEQVPVTLAGVSSLATDPVTGA